MKKEYNDGDLIFIEGMYYRINIIDKYSFGDSIPYRTAYLKKIGNQQEFDKLRKSFVQDATDEEVKE